MKRHGIFLAAALGLCALAQAEVINITQGSTTGYTMTDGNTYVIQESVCFSNSIAGGNGMSANGRDSVMECYIAGLVPTNAEGVFRTVISWRDGAPQISWEPKLMPLKRPSALTRSTGVNRSRLAHGGQRTPTAVSSG